MIKQPYRCPVCSGKGLVPNGFYMAVGVNGHSTTSASPESCRSCAGSGVIWTQEEYQPNREWLENLSASPGCSDH